MVQLERWHFFAGLGMPQFPLEELEVVASSDCNQDWQKHQKLDVIKKKEKERKKKDWI